MSPVDLPSTHLLREQGPEASRRLLVAFAHPDDESFGPAGTLIHYAEQGVAVHYVCGTRGEVGAAAEEHMQGHDSPAAMRTAELMCAAEHLGLTGLHFLGYRDSGMEGSPDNAHPAALAAAEVEAVAERITRLIRTIRPQVVLTFDPTGGYFHPDHIAMHHATKMAFEAAGDPARFPEQIAGGLAPWQADKLYYTTFPRGLVRLSVLLMPLFGKDPSKVGDNEDIDLRRIAAVRQRVTTRIAVGRYYDARMRAVRCHASQVGPQRGGIFSLVRRFLMRHDGWQRVVPPPASGEALERDLFAGVDGT
jgi:LmbE family N-acetylglucosaminyl deacetylase